MAPKPWVAAEPRKSVLRLALNRCLANDWKDYRLEAVVSECYVPHGCI